MHNQFIKNTLYARYARSIGFVALSQYKAVRPYVYDVGCLFCLHWMACPAAWRLCLCCACLLQLLIYQIPFGCGATTSQRVADKSLQPRSQVKPSQPPISRAPQTFPELYHERHAPGNPTAEAPARAAAASQAAAETAATTAAASKRTCTPVHSSSMGPPAKRRRVVAGQSESDLSKDVQAADTEPDDEAMLAKVLGASHAAGSGPAASTSRPTSGVAHCHANASDAAAAAAAAHKLLPTQQLQEEERDQRSNGSDRQRRHESVGGNANMASDAARGATSRARAAIDGVTMTDCQAADTEGNEARQPPDTGLFLTHNQLADIVKHAVQKASQQAIKMALAPLVQEINNFQQEIDNHQQEIDNLEQQIQHQCQHIQDVSQSTQH